MSTPMPLNGAVAAVAAAPGPRMTLLRALDLQDATTAIALVRSNQVVLINCSAMQEPLAQRFIDMVSGGIVAMDGQIRQLSPQVMLACSGLTSLQGDPDGDRAGRRRHRR